MLCSGEIVGRGSLIWAGGGEPKSFYTRVQLQRPRGFHHTMQTYKGMATAVEVQWSATT